MLFLLFSDHYLAQARATYSGNSTRSAARRAMFSANLAAASQMTT
jgi:hypothetical protein